MQKQRETGKADDPGDAADADRQQLLERVRDAERVENPDRRQQPDQMAGEDDQNADVKQVRAPDQLPPPQQLARAAAPGVLLAVEANQAAEQKHGEAEVRIPAEHDVGEGLGHVQLLAGAESPGARRRPARILAISPSLQLLAFGPNVTCSSSHAASSAAKSSASGSGSASSADTASALGLAAASAVSARNTDS